MFIDIESILSYCDKIYSHEDPTDFFLIIYPINILMRF